MTTTWLENLLNGRWGNIVTTATSSPALCNVNGTATATCQANMNAVTILGGQISGIIPAVLPTVIAVTVLFTFYFVLKALYHARF